MIPSLRGENRKHLFLRGNDPPARCGNVEIIGYRENLFSKIALAGAGYQGFLIYLDLYGAPFAVASEV